MLSMLKLLATTTLLSSILVASPNKKVEEFLEESFSKNPNISDLSVHVNDTIAIKSMKGWSALIVTIDATVTKPQNRKIKQKMIWFTDGNVITKDLTEIDTGLSLKDMVSPTFKPAQYKRENLIYGRADAEHKVAIFSDPLCPFCRTFVPEAIKEMRKQPKKFAIYYYHFPLPSIHPAAVELSLAAVAAELKGRKNVVLDMYKVEVDPREKDVKKILAAFNKTMKTNITPADIKTPDVMKHYNSDMTTAEELMVGGTPTMFFDGTLDRTKRKYKKVK